MHAVVTGGAGFIGTHLVRRLLDAGWKVTIIDDLSTGTYTNVDKRAELFCYDVRIGSWLSSVDLPVDAVWHLASPCSPADYQQRRTETLLINSEGTMHALDLAARNQASFVLASTSEVYGDPQEHPQAETYSGNVDPTGPRACYDEGKRFAEALTFAYGRESHIDVKVARLFNTYGPLMPDDGRVVIRFLSAALAGEPLAVQGDGEHTRSFCYVDDAVDGLIRFSQSKLTVCNIGGEDEVSVQGLAESVITIVGSTSEIKHVAAAEHDPQQRRPDLSRLRGLGWEQRIALWMGLSLTAEWLREQTDE